MFFSPSHGKIMIFLGRRSFLDSIPNGKLEIYVVDLIHVV